MSYREKFFADFLKVRGVEKACTGCNGTGAKSYPDTSTWRGDGGGQSFEIDVCDECWGSGDVKPWPSHREFFEMKRELKLLKRGI